MSDIKNGITYNLFTVIILMIENLNFIVMTIKFTVILTVMLCMR